MYEKENPRSRRYGGLTPLPDFHWIHNPSGMSSPFVVVGGTGVRHLGSDPSLHTGLIVGPVGLRIQGVQPLH